MRKLKKVMMYILKNKCLPKSISLSSFFLIELRNNDKKSYFVSTKFHLKDAGKSDIKLSIYRIMNHLLEKDFESY